MDNKERYILIILGREIHNFRANHKQWTQEYLAEISGLTVNYISLIERGKRNCGILTYRKIARAFGMPLNLLFDFRLYAKDYDYFEENERI